MAIFDCKLFGSFKLLRFHRFSNLTDSCKSAISSQIPAAIATKLRADLSEKQMGKVIKMIQKGIGLLPNHWFVKEIPTDDKLPRPGALDGWSRPLRKTGGRNHHGKITVRHRGGGFKRRIRILDRHRTSDSLHKVLRIEHDPNRSAKIALVRDLQTNELKYVLASEEMAKGEGFVFGGSELGQRAGNTLKLRDIAIGTTIHNVESKPGRGGQLVRAAGTCATLVGKDQPTSESNAKFAIIRLPSGESKKILLDCRATIGRVSNGEWQNRVIGKAGRMRNLGRRPKVRGVAMNAVDHPHGGGKGGKSKGKHSQSIWGWICK